MENQPPTRKPNPTDVSDDEWAFVAPYLALMTPDAPQRRHDLREVFDASSGCTSWPSPACCIASSRSWPNVHNRL